jgi:hypothetical protein
MATQFHGKLKRLTHTSETIVLYGIYNVIDTIPNISLG